MKASSVRVNYQKENKDFLEAMSQLTPPNSQAPMTGVSAPASPSLLARSFAPQRISSNTQLRLANIQVSNPSLSAQSYSNHLESETKQLNFFRPELTTKEKRHLKNGTYAIADEIDLHGLNVQQAKTQLLDFLMVQINQCNSQSNAVSCVKIIHGKGRNSDAEFGKLKIHVNHWLKQIHQVKGFCSCLPIDGGCGAVYALLKI